MLGFNEFSTAMFCWVIGFKIWCFIGSLRCFRVVQTQLNRGLGCQN
jgi:hypothetical protein